MVLSQRGGGGGGVSYFLLSCKTHPSPLSLASGGLPKCYTFMARMTGRKVWYMVVWSVLRFRDCLVRLQNCGSFVKKKRVWRG